MTSCSVALVTGAAGFLGATLVEVLASAGRAVVAFDIAKPARPLPAGVTFRRIDLCERRAVSFAPLPPGEHTVFHLAGWSHAGACREDPEAAYAQNVSATLHVLEACRAAGIRRFVLPSTALIYARPQPMPLEENAPTAPSSIYTATKLAAEGLVTAYAAEYELNTGIARLGNVYGAGGHPDSVVRILIDQAVAGRPLSVRSGAPVRDFIHKHDVVGALIAIGDTCNTPGCRVFNVSGGCGVSVREFAAALSQAIDKPSALIEADTAGSDDVLALSNQRIRQQLGWRPTLALVEGLRQTLDELGAARG